MSMNNSARGALPLVLLVVSAVGQAADPAASADGPVAALRATTPLIDIRARYEEVEQTGIAYNAHAETLRARLGGRSGSWFGTRILAEGEGCSGSIAITGPTMQSPPTRTIPSWRIPRTTC